MKKTLLLVAIMFVLSVATAHAAFIADTYLHPLDADVGQRGMDVIGENPPFDIKGSDWATTTTLNIYTDWNLGLSGEWSSYYRVQLGDLLIGTSRGLTYGVALRDHIVEGDGIKAGDIYTISGTYSSDWYYGTSGALRQLSTSMYGDHEIVTGYGDIVGKASIGYNSNGTANPGDYVITVQFDTSAYGDDVIRFASTCGNDIHVAVPEPVTLLFLGLGFVGAGICGYRRRKNG